MNEWMNGCVDGKTEGRGCVDRRMEERRELMNEGRKEKEKRYKERMGRTFLTQITKKKT